METGVNLLKLLEEKEVLLKKLEHNYQGSGFLKNFKRLLRYRGKYLKYGFLKLLKLRYLIKSKTFWGKDAFILLPEYFDFYYFGIISGIEFKLAKFFIKNLKENSVFYDVGANFGYYSLLAKEIIKTGEVHSFEPAPEIFKLLEKNLSKEQNVILNQMALSNEKKKTDFFYHKNHSGGSTLDVAITKHDFDFLKINIQAITLDDYFSNHLAPDFLKIDVEGAESQVIEGGIKTLKEINPIIAMEIWKKPLDNNSHLKAVEILYGLGYKSYKINDEGELEFMEKIDPERDILKEYTCDNFIFKKL